MTLKLRQFTKSVPVPRQRVGLELVGDIQHLRNKSTTTTKKIKSLEQKIDLNLNLFKLALKLENKRVKEKLGLLVDVLGFQLAPSGGVVFHACGDSERN